MSDMCCLGTRDVLNGTTPVLCGHQTSVAFGTRAADMCCLGTRHVLFGFQDGGCVGSRLELFVGARSVLCGCQKCAQLVPQVFWVGARSLLCVCCVMIFRFSDLGIWFLRLSDLRHFIFFLLNEPDVSPTPSKALLSKLPSFRGLL